MRKFVLIGVVVAVAGGAAAYFGVFSSPKAATNAVGGAQAGAPSGAAGRGGRAGGQRPQGQGGGGGLNANTGGQ